jgi:hypothetical protein
MPDGSLAELYFEFVFVAQTMAPSDRPPYPVGA